MTLVLMLTTTGRMLITPTDAFQLQILMLFILLPAKSIIRLTKHSLIRSKSDQLSESNSSRSFWHLTNNLSSNFTKSSFPPLFCYDGSVAIFSLEKANLFGCLFL